MQRKAYFSSYFNVCFWKFQWRLSQHFWGILKRKCFCNILCFWKKTCSCLNASGWINGGGSMQHRGGNWRVILSQLSISLFLTSLLESIPRRFLFSFPFKLSWPQQTTNNNTIKNCGDSPDTNSIYRRQDFWIYQTLT